MNQKTLLWILLGLVISLATINILDINFFPTDEVEQVVTKKEIVKDVKQIEKDYAFSLKELQHVNDSLDEELLSAKSQMKSTTKKVKLLEKNVSGLLVKSSVTKDTSRQLALCDSLKSEVSELLEQRSFQDTLCDSVIDNLTAMVTQKEAEANLCQSSYTKLKGTLNVSVIQQEYLTKQLKKEQRKSRRRMIQSRLLGIGVVVLSGATASLLLTQRL